MDPLIQQIKADVSEISDRIISLQVTLDKIKDLEPPKKKQKTANKVDLIVEKKLPMGMTPDRFRAAIVPFLEDFITGPVTYRGWNLTNDGTRCYNFSGMCPLHMRYHDGQAWKWQIKQHQTQNYSGIKCWRDNSYSKQVEIAELKY